VIKNKEAREAFVRIPRWVDQQAVRCRVGERETAGQEWLGRYLRVKDLGAGDVVTIEFPVVERVEQWTQRPGGLYVGTGASEGDDVTYTCRFKGNTLVEITPPLEQGPYLYQQRREKYSATEAPTRRVNRFVTPMILKW